MRIITLGTARRMVLRVLPGPLCQPLFAALTLLRLHLDKTRALLRRQLGGNSLVPVFEDGGGGLECLPAGGSDLLGRLLQNRLYPRLLINGKIELLCISLQLLGRRGLGRKLMHQRRTGEESRHGACDKNAREGGKDFPSGFHRSGEIEHFANRIVERGGVFAVERGADGIVAGGDAHRHQKGGDGQTAP